jgi:hypothetical protein
MKLFAFSQIVALALGSKCHENPLPNKDGKCCDICSFTPLTFLYLVMHQGGAIALEGLSLQCIPSTFPLRIVTLLLATTSP